MARLHTGLLGIITGKIGNKVAVNSKRGNFLREAPRKSTKPPTAAQIIQREKFRVMAVFLRPMKEVISRYFGEKSRLKSRCNLAMSYNLREAIRVKDESVVIDYEKVLFTKGYLSGIKVKKVEKQKRGLRIQWETITNSLAKNKDWINIIIYSKTKDIFCLLEYAVNREMCTYMTILPEAFEEGECVMWLYVTNAKESQCSTSMFLGTF